jgi:hypothetical protein
MTSMFSDRARIVIAPKNGAAVRSGTLILAPVKHAVGRAT